MSRTRTGCGCGSRNDPAVAGHSPGELGSGHAAVGEATGVAGGADRRDRGDRPLVVDPLGARAVRRTVWPPFDPPAPAPRPVIVPQVSDEPLPVATVAAVVPDAPDAPDAPDRPSDVASRPTGRRGWPRSRATARCDHPVKANDNSGIFHVPGGRFYDRTKAERCYVDAESAAADGYRAAKA